MIKIKKLYHLGLPVNDLDRATKFYSDVLGMKCTKVGLDVDSGGPYKKVYGQYPSTSRLFFEDEMCLVLFQRPKPIERGDFDDGTAHIALQTGKEDFDRAVEELKKAGAKVLIDEPVVRPTGRGIYFFDPEGNYIQLQCPE
ncbi:MAG: VOC family protein [Candidatus Binatia bacterium]